MFHSFPNQLAEVFSFSVACWLKVCKTDSRDFMHALVIPSGYWSADTANADYFSSGKNPSIATIIVSNHYVIV
tara:strand:+ start:480 stop:698 length:219 start_codon:yes stop_codon:yes gene_type:complete